MQVFFEKTTRGSDVWSAVRPGDKAVPISCLAQGIARVLETRFNFYLVGCSRWNAQVSQILNKLSSNINREYTYGRLGTVPL